MKTINTLFIIIILLSYHSFSYSQDEIIFQTEGSSFNPLISLKGEAYVRWTFHDGDTSNSLNPLKNYDSEAARISSLIVQPWSALKMINIGYDAGDGGSSGIPFVADQQVSKIQNLDLVKEYLEIWCSSYNLIDTLIFDDFVMLDTVECFLSQNVKHVSLKNTPALTRLCLEDNDLATLDISGCTGLMDLRGAVNNYSTIEFSESCEELWHICVRDNPQISNDTMFKNAEKFPNLTELFIWNTNQKGSFNAHNCFMNSWVTIMADRNHYTELNLSGGIIQGDGGSWISFNNNHLVSVNIEGFSEIYHLELKNNDLVSDTVDKILYQADQLGIHGNQDRIISLLGNDGPSASGMVYKKNLEDKGWIIEVENGTLEIPENTIMNRNKANMPEVFPNPGNGIVTIRTPGHFKEYELTLVNSSGAKVYDGVINSDTFDLSPYGKGIYFLLIKNGQDITGKKVIIH